jgi:hypothetical protein
MKEAFICQQKKSWEAMMKPILLLVALVLLCGSMCLAQNVLILEDEGTEDSVYAILTRAGFTVTLGGSYWTYTGVGINQYRLVILLNGVAYGNPVPDSVQSRIRNYVANGGGLLTTEWILWDENNFGILRAILSSRYGGTYAYSPELYRKRATHAISQNLPDSFLVPTDWSFSTAVRDTAAAKQAITVFNGALSGDAVVAGRYGNGKVVHWNMGGQKIGADIWSAEVRTLLRNIASYAQGVSSVDEHASIPHETALWQNYPNPFNPSTKIKFEIPRASEVSLKVFDVLGREVTVLINERLEAGSYERTFDASGLASGVYFCRLQAGEFVQTKRLLLMR